MKAQEALQILIDCAIDHCIAEGTGTYSYHEVSDIRAALQVFDKTNLVATLESLLADNSNNGVL